MRKYVSDLIVDLLQRFGVPYVSLNPGSSFRGLHDSLVNYGGNRPEIVECPHEKIAVGIAHGYARVTGRPMATVLHNVVGLLHGSMGVYQAFLDRVPMLVLGATGPADVALRRPRIDWDHTALLQGTAVRDLVKWTTSPWGWTRWWSLSPGVTGWRARNPLAPCTFATTWPSRRRSSSGR